MPSDLTGLKVFIASPGGLEELRKAFREEIQEFNEADAVPRGVLFQPVGWEDTLGAIGRPQRIINEDVRKADYFVLLLWNRWGTPPDVSSSSFSSGTEEEYHVALECHGSDDYPMRQLVIMFKAVEPQQLNDPGAQLQKVLDFRSDIEQRKTHLFKSFDTTDSFRRLLRKHLAAWLRDQENGGLAQKSVAPLLPTAVGASVGSTEQQLLDRGPDGLAVGYEGDTGQQAPAPSESSTAAKAWALANAGRLTDAEVEFARIIVGRQRPLDLVEYGRFLHRVGRLDQAKVMF